MDIKFCTACGAETKIKIPDDDDHNRAVCTTCGQIHYENPKMVVGTIPIKDDHILLCKRNIEPRKGLWTLPAGFLECNESAADGAIRETIEETRVPVEIICPYRMCNIVYLSQIYFIFLATLSRDDFGPTKESLEVCLFNEEQIPWDQIAFPVIKTTLEHYFSDVKTGKFLFQMFDIRERKVF